MRTVPFFPALTCPRCGTAHDFYVPGVGGLPFADGALYVYRCPVTALPESLAPAVRPDSADLFAGDSVPLFRVG